VALAFSGVAAALWLVVLLVLGSVISRVFILQHTIADVAPLIMVIVGLAFTPAPLSWSGEIVGQRAADRVTRHLRESIVGKLILLGPSFAHGERTGELVHI